MKNKIIIIIVTLTCLNLIAQSKGFTDTVKLKNGIKLEGVKATAVSDSLVVTKADGETSVYAKKEVSEVINGTSQAETTKTSQGGNWSDYQGAMNLEAAKKKCASIGMRLPTIEELKVANEMKTTEPWEIDGYYYWSSTPSNDGLTYIRNIFNGHSGMVRNARGIVRNAKGEIPDDSVNVRCIR